TIVKITRLVAARIVRNRRRDTQGARARLRFEKVPQKALGSRTKMQRSLTAIAHVSGLVVVRKPSAPEPKVSLTRISAWDCRFPKLAGLTTPSAFPYGFSAVH